MTSQATFVTVFSRGPRESTREQRRRVCDLGSHGLGAHGGGEVEIAVKIAMAAEPACAGLPEERALVCSDLIRISLSEAARKALEALMATTHGYEYQSDFARKHRAEGQAQGIILGQAKARAEAVITVLEARRMPPTHEQREQILGCADLETLGQWIRKAATVSSADDLFE